MKKLFTTLMLFALAAPAVTAQTTGGPDSFGYVWRNSNDPMGPSYSWIDIDSLPGTVNVMGLTDDNIVGPFTMNIPFKYYWYDPAEFWIGSNGYIGFTSVPVAHPFPVIPTPTLIQDYLAAMTTDLTFTDNANNPVPGAACMYWFSPGSDSLVVTWKNVPFWDPSGFVGLNTFQAVLSTLDSSITYNYQMQNGASVSTTSFVTTGIENNSGNIGLQVLYNFYPVANSSVKFYYPDTITLAINDASTTYCNNPENGGLFLAKDGAAYSSVAEIANQGNTILDTVRAYSRVVNGFNIVQVRDTVEVTNFTQGATQVINFPDTWSPTGTGTFRHITETLLPGDATPSNNQKTLEMVVIDTTQSSILLTFDNGIDAGLGGISWNGGSGGTGMYFEPPFAPYNITRVRAFIVANATPPVGFSLMIFDDDGPNGAPMTLLDSVAVASTSVLVGGWNEVMLPTPVTLNSGGFYVAWMMGGSGIALGQNQVPPVSNRTFEILGPATTLANWAVYRFREIEEVMINAFIEVPVGIGQNDVQSAFAVYPNPASDRVTVSFNTMDKELLSYRIFDIQGSQVLAGEIGYVSGSGAFDLDVSTLQNGMYVCEFRIGTETVPHKINVMK